MPNDHVLGPVRVEVGQEAQACAQSLSGGSAAWIDLLSRPPIAISSESRSVPVQPVLTCVQGKLEVTLGLVDHADRRCRVEDPEDRVPKGRRVQAPQSSTQWMFTPPML